MKDIGLTILILRKVKEICSCEFVLLAQLIIRPWYLHVRYATSLVCFLGTRKQDLLASILIAMRTQSTRQSDPR